MLELKFGSPLNGIKTQPCEPLGWIRRFIVLLS